MLSSRETLPVSCAPHFHEPDHATQAHRRELTHLILGEKNYFLRIANCILRNEADAEDAVHNAFCSAWKALPTFRGESSMKTWFSRIVSNHALDLLRRLRRNQLLFIEDDPDCLQNFEHNFSSVIEDPEQIAAQHEALRLVRKHLGSLPHETRAVFVLFLSQGCTIDQIAEMRGKTHSSVTAHLQRGKAILRKSVRKIPIHRVPLQHSHSSFC